MDRECGHPRSVGNSQYMPVVVLTPRLLQVLKTLSLQEVLSSSGLPGSLVVSGSYRVYRIAAGVPETIVSFIEGFFRYRSVPGTKW